MLERVQEIFKEICGFAVTGEDKLAPLNLDPLDMAEMVSMVEQEFNVTIPDRRVESWVTINDILAELNNTNRQ